MPRSFPDSTPVLAGGIVTIEPPPPPTAEQRIAAVMQRARRHVARRCFRAERLVVSPADVAEARRIHRPDGWYRVGRLTDMYGGQHWHVWWQPTTERAKVERRPGIRCDCAPPRETEAAVVD